MGFQIHTVFECYGLLKSGNFCLKTEKVSRKVKFSNGILIPDHNNGPKKVCYTEVSGIKVSGSQISTRSRMKLVL